MKNLYRILASGFFFFLFMQSGSQILGLRAGMNLSRLKYSAEGESKSLDLKPGLQIGPVAEFPSGSNFAFETGMFISLKGGKESSNGGKNVLSIIYLEVPANFKAYFPAGSLRVFGMAGPYLGIAIAGKDKYTFEGQIDTYKLNFGSGNYSDVKRMDFGVGVGAGIEIKNIQARFSYGMGLANISCEQGLKIKNNTVAITVALRFGVE